MRPICDEYTLRCSCTEPAAASRWFGNEMKSCEVSKEAYRRGYGTAEELASISSRGRALDEPPSTWFEFGGGGAKSARNKKGQITKNTKVHEGC